MDAISSSDRYGLLHIKSGRNWSNRITGWNLIKIGYHVDTSISKMLYLYAMLMPTCLSNVIKEGIGYVFGRAHTDMQFHIILYYSLKLKYMYDWSQVYDHWLFEISFSLKSHRWKGMQKPMNRTPYFVICAIFVVTRKVSVLLQNVRSWQKWKEKKILDTFIIIAGIVLHVITSIKDMQSWLK